MKHNGVIDVESYPREPFWLTGNRHLRTVIRSVREVSIIAQAIPSDGVGFLRLWSRIHRPVRGWLRAGDAQFLYTTARCGFAHGDIVEIGSAWGRSTIVLAAAARRAQGKPVYAIDPHTGDPTFLEQARLASFSSLEEFTQNIERFGVRDWVIPIVEPSQAAATQVAGPIRLLYIDGLHSYAGVRADIETWVPKVAAGGIVVFDDYFNRRPDVGVYRAVNELVRTGDVSRVHRVVSLAWVRKR